MRVLHHAYVREGHPMPKAADGSPVPQAWIVHVAHRSEGTGLDIWWWALTDEDEV